jgi:hypothetical protein
MTKLLAVTVALCVGLLSASAHAAPGELHAASGLGQMVDGAWLAVASEDLAVGHATLFAETRIEIQLACIEVDWVTTPYPIWPWIPYHVMYAAGTGNDGVDYYITLADRSPLGAGHADLLNVEKTRGSGPCGAAEDAAPVAGGDFTIAP